MAPAMKAFSTTSICGPEPWVRVRALAVPLPDWIPWDTVTLLSEAPEGSVYSSHK